MLMMVNRARELYNKALNLQPLHIHSMLTLGELEAKYGDPLVASKLFKKASSTYPTNAHAKHHVALFYRSDTLRCDCEAMIFFSCPVQCIQIPACILGI